ncbi:hypothetical protein AHAS_Ahas09G0179000 [Arachis hypogaea]|uniref:FAR1 domain-containing protein n=1 Tax=Arachis hypogaea TaxID=3818 RepID=A0A445BHW7_ARAHY|nr:hypothetical protein Ahy_A09g043240 [Arachis hypogaea]
MEDCPTTVVDNVAGISDAFDWLSHMVDIGGYQSREGFRDNKWLQMHHLKREHKVVTRCRCPAEMRIKPRDSTEKWYVSRFVDNHNHDLPPTKFVDEYLPSHLKISDVDIAHMDSMRQIGISIPKIYKSIAA